MKSILQNRLDRHALDEQTALPLLRQPAVVGDLDFRMPRGLDRTLLIRLPPRLGPRSRGRPDQRRDRHRKILGLCSLPRRVSPRSLDALLPFSRGLRELALARADGSYPKLLDKLTRTQLLFLDDFGLTPLSDSERRDLLEVLEDRYGRRATLVTRQLPSTTGTTWSASPHSRTRSSIAWSTTLAA